MGEDPPPKNVISRRGDFEPASSSYRFRNSGSFLGISPTLSICMRASNPSPLYLVVPDAGLPLKAVLRKHLKLIFFEL